MAIFLVKISAQDVPCIFCMIFLPSFESHAPNLKDTPMKLHETINRVVVETFWCLAMAPEAVLLNNLSRKARIWARQKNASALRRDAYRADFHQKEKKCIFFGLWVSFDLSTAGEKNASSAILGYESWWILLDCRWSKAVPWLHNYLASNLLILTSGCTMVSGDKNSSWLLSLVSKRKANSHTST